MLPQQQPGTPIKAATAPGGGGGGGGVAAEVHRRNLTALGGSLPFGLSVFWVVVAILGSILQLAGLVRGFETRVGGVERRTIFFFASPLATSRTTTSRSRSLSFNQKTLNRPRSSPTPTASASSSLTSRPTTR